MSSRLSIKENMNSQYNPHSEDIDHLVFKYLGSCEAAVSFGQNYDFYSQKKLLLPVYILT